MDNIGYTIPQHKYYRLPPETLIKIPQTALPQEISVLHDSNAFNKICQAYSVFILVFFVIFLLSQQRNTRLFKNLMRLFVPDGGLHLADVRLAQQQHRHARLAYAAADRERQLAIEEHLVIG